MLDSQSELYYINKANSFKIGEMMTVENGNNVSVHYRGTLSNGTEFDNSKSRGQTLNFTVGSGQMIPGFDRALLGMSAGETKTVTFGPDDAYGARNEEAIQDVPKSAFGEGFQFLVGEVVQGNGPQGPFMAKIQEEREEEVVLDFNHPLAGEELSFEIELVSVNEATPVEATETTADTTTTEE